MLKQAPVVYVPTEPEGDGVAMPSLLSLVVHGAIVGFILLSHQIPEVVQPAGLETTLVSQSELAQMQADALASASSNNTGITANANSSSNNSTSVDVTLDASSPPQDNSVSEMVRRSVSVFTRSDNPPDGQPSEYGVSGGSSDDVILDNGFDREAYAEELARKQANHDEAREAFERQLESEIQAEQQAYEEYLQAQYEAEQARLKELRKAQANPEKVDKPERVETQYSPKPRPKADGGGKTQSFSLGDGSPASETSSKSSGSPSRSAGSSGSSGGGKSESTLAGELKRILQPRVDSATPAGLSRQTVSVSIRVDGSGNVTSVSVSSGNAGLKSAIEGAVRSASPLRPFVGTDYTSATISLTIQAK